MAARRLVFHVGGPAFHPTADQAVRAAQWLGPDYSCILREDRAAFAALDECDLLVLMGLFWTGSQADWAGGRPYVPLDDASKAALERYALAGKPILVHHGAILSYDDWPAYGRIAGFIWKWGVTNHADVAEHRVRVVPTGHPIIRGVDDYSLVDELYHDVQLTPGLEPQIHAEAPWRERAHLPMVMTARDAGVAGKGRRVFLANGHDLRAFACPALRQLWINAVRWLLREE